MKTNETQWESMETTHRYPTLLSLAQRGSLPYQGKPMKTNGKRMGNFNRSIAGVALVWRGSATATVKEKPEAAAKQIENVVNKMVKKWTNMKKKMK